MMRYENRVNGGRTLMARGKISTLFFLLLLCFQVDAHESRPALLDITEIESGEFDVHWKVPATGSARLAISPTYPEHCTTGAHRELINAVTAIIENSHLYCAEQGLRDGTIVIEGLDKTITTVLLRIQTLDGGSLSTILSPSRISYRLPDVLSEGTIVVRYFELGVRHILGGIDHLLFVLGLLLLVEGTRKLIITITSFTVAHSITLGLATLGMVPAPGSITEALIALSIVFVALEVLRYRSGKESYSTRQPWILAFLFGLLHGMGFAGALLDIGLPVSETFVALLFFNLGVEAGQLLFLTAIVSLMGIARTMLSVNPSRWSVVTSYVIGTAGAYWFLERMIVFD